MPVAAQYPVMAALHDFVVEYLEPQGVSPHTIRAYTSDVTQVSYLVAALTLDAGLANW